MVASDIFPNTVLKRPWFVTVSETLFETLCHNRLQPSITNTNRFSKQIHWENKEPARSIVVPAK